VEVSALSGHSGSIHKTLTYTLFGQALNTLISRIELCTYNDKVYLVIKKHTADIKTKMKLGMVSTHCFFTSYSDIEMKYSQLDG